MLNFYVLLKHPLSPIMIQVRIAIIWMCCLNACSEKETYHVQPIKGNISAFQTGGNR